MRKERLRLEKQKGKKQCGKIANNFDDFIYDKKMTNDEIIEKGEITKVKSMTLTGEDFRVEVRY